ncbi:homeodomain-like protein [Tanacetum coccineum]|uniref:Homeodomain-like protein n=1 Tax=Tanacetum coccineum TaxID=301880 RepID=A0ABQ5I0P1_9ASTR
MYETRQVTIPFLSCLNGYYCKEKKGSYGPQFSKAYSKASHINNSIPRNEKDPGRFTLPCFINNVCFDNALVDLGASVSVMPLSTYLDLGLGELAHTRLTVELVDRFHNSIMKEKMVYKGNNVVGAFMNVPIFVGTFSVMTDFAVLENIDAYRDEGMGDVIFGEPFLREVGIKTRRLEGIITIYNGDDEVNYQMVRSHPRFKHRTNEQCNKIPPLLKVSEKDEKNGISYAYQKLKGF